jgi:hypothetical protein
MLKPKADQPAESEMRVGGGPKELMAISQQKS